MGYVACRSVVPRFTGNLPLKLPETALSVIIVATVLAIPIIGMALFRATDDRPMLQDIQARALPLFETTALLIDPGFEPRPHPGSDPEGPLDIAGDPFGYQDCDGWRGWFLPGWSAATWHDFDVDDEQRRAGIIAEVRSLWEQQDGGLTVSDPDDARPLQLRNGEITYSLEFPENPAFSVPDGVIVVSTACLPTD